MKYILLVGAGGIAGSLTRFILNDFFSARTKGFPYGTFVINITGCFLLGCIVSLNPGKGLYSLVATGFLGAYTTFSTFMYESFKLIEGNSNMKAIMYMALSIVLGVSAIMAGMYLGNLI